MRGIKEVRLPENVTAPMRNHPMVNARNPPSLMASTPPRSPKQAAMRNVKETSKPAFLRFKSRSRMLSGSMGDMENTLIPTVKWAQSISAAITNLKRVTESLLLILVICYLQFV